jgi:hypothetical protein
VEEGVEVRVGLKVSVGTGVIGHVGAGFRLSAGGSDPSRDEKLYLTLPLDLRTNIMPQPGSKPLIDMLIF